MLAAMKQLDEFWPRVIADATADIRSIHGTDHWAHVECNEIDLTRLTGADEPAVRLSMHMRSEIT